MSNVDEVLFTMEERVATITINRPEARNALNANVLANINLMIDKAAADSGVGVIILTGAGGKAFCAGADLSASFSADKPFLDQHEERGHFANLLLKMNRCPKPILGAVEGYCLAGGIGLCLACDIVIASEDSQFGLPEIQRGLWPYIVTAALIRNVGRKKALALCMMGERISAAEAARVGIINDCVPRADYKKRVGEMAKRLASFSPAVMGLGKKSFYAIADMEFGAALDYLKAQLTLNTQCEDIREGISAFLQKREPQWKGR